jgi:hypothetical protein
MLLIVLVLAVVSWVFVVTAGVTGSPGFGWMSIGASLAGLALLILDEIGERKRRRSVRAEDNGVLRSDVHYVDYRASDRPAHDAPVHDDHEVERSVQREELHIETGSGSTDVSGARASDTISGTHFLPGHDRGKLSQ